MSRILVTLTVIAIAGPLCSSVVTAQQRARDSSDALPDVQTLIEQAYLSLGPVEKLDEIESIRAVAQCTSPTGPYETEIHSIRGGKLMFRQRTEDGREFVAIVNGDVAWAPATNKDTLRILEDPIRAMVQGHEFQMMVLDLEGRFHDPRMEGVEEFSGSECIKIRMTSFLGNPLSVFFHRQTLLVAGLVLTNSMNPEENVWVRFAEWREVEGIKLPVKVLVTDTSGDFVLAFHEVALNDVDESTFVLPDELSGAGDGP